MGLLHASGGLTFYFIASTRKPRTRPGLDGIAPFLATLFNSRMYEAAFFGCLLAAFVIFAAISRHMDSRLRKQGRSEPPDKGTLKGHVDG